MVVFYDIMGRKVGSHYLAIGILSTVFAGIGYATSGGKKAIAGQTPPINASSKEEGDFIQQFLKETESGKAKH